MKKIAIIYGTRPEFLKVLPIIFEAKKRNLNFITINTGQHSNLLNELENLFDFKPDYNLKVQDVKSSNSELLSNIILRINDILKKEKFEILNKDIYKIYETNLDEVGKKEFLKFEINFFNSAMTGSHSNSNT